MRNVRKKSNSKLSQSLFKNKGFTLIELMVTVGILGVLTMIANANFTKYMSRARTSEAKISLSSAYTLLKAFYVESTQYTACIVTLGYGFEGSKRFYTVGFDASVATALNCGPNSNTQCIGYAWNDDGSIRTSCGGAPPRYALAGSTGISNGHPSCPIPGTGAISFTALTSQSFTLGAIGCISNKPSAVDQWTLSDLKVLSNRTVGY